MNMTLRQLETRASIITYGFFAVMMGLLAFTLQQYGLFPLFYLALVMAPLALFGALLSFYSRHDEPYEGAHLVILLALTATLLFGPVEASNHKSHWTYAIGLLAFFNIRTSWALCFSLVLALVFAYRIWLDSDTVSAIRYFATFLLLGSTAAVYTYFYQFKSRALQSLSTLDPQTGTYTLRHFNYTLKQEVSRATHTGHSLSLCCLDIDYFQHTSDVHGRSTMNQLLTELASELMHMVRAGDSVYYAGEGRFFLILPFTPEEGVLVIAERIRRTIEQKDWPMVERLTVSLGCVNRPADCHQATALRDGAIQACQEAKNSGHNRVVVKQLEAAQGQ